MGEATMHTELKLSATDSPDLIWERREEARVHCCGERLLWKGERGKRSRKGWLNDVSASGVSFLIEQRRIPNAGESVEIRTGSRSVPTAYRVVRITPEGSDLALVACEREAEVMPVLYAAA